MKPLDPSTGLPPVPYNNSYWRVAQRDGFSRKYSYMELRAKKKVFFGLFKLDWLVRDQIMLELSKPEMIKRANEIIRSIENEKLNIELLGDYPPKSVND